MTLCRTQALLGTALLMIVFLSPSAASAVAFPDEQLQALRAYVESLINGGREEAGLPPVCAPTL